MVAADSVDIEYGQQNDNLIHLGSRTLTIIVNGDADPILFSSCIYMGSRPCNNKGQLWATGFSFRMLVRLKSL